MSDAVVDLLRQAFDAAVASAQPQVCVPPFIPAAPKGRLIVVGAGKASAAMARAVELHAPCAVSGLVVTHTAMRWIANTLRSCKPPIRYPMKRACRPPNACCRWCKA